MMHSSGDSNIAMAGKSPFSVGYSSSFMVDFPAIAMLVPKSLHSLLMVQKSDDHHLTCMKPCQ